MTTTFPLWPEGAPFAQGSELEDQPRLTPFIVQKDEPTACVIVLPGGGYRGRAQHEGAPVAQWLNGIGISAFVLDYRVAPYRHPAPLTDAQRAIRHVRHHAAQWRIDPNRIGILGFSAGGHLACTAGMIFDDGDSAASDPVDRVSSRADLMVLCYPVISLSAPYIHGGSKKNLLGEEASPELAESLSGERLVTDRTPPAFLWSTADDAAVPVENSLYLALELRKHKIPFDLHVYESGNHGLGLAVNHKEAFAWTGECERWLRRQGF